MIRNILVPTDGSERAEQAADFAIELASAIGASLFFLNVVDEIAPAYAYEIETGASLNVVELDEERHKFAKSAVGRMVEKAKAAGVASEGKVLEGHPWQEILKAADSSGADHIVIGSHGRRALAAAVLGNVTINVIHGSKIPVTVIPEKKAQ
ncbi:MAG: universal stress protein [Thermoleophilia bacterium]